MLQRDNIMRNEQFGMQTQAQHAPEPKNSIDFHMYSKASVGDPDPDPHVFGIPDPDPLVRGADSDPAADPDPSLFS